jgi:ribosomal protein L32E
MSKEFKRTDYMRSFKLGKARARVPWRRARGVHSKIRRKRFGYPRKPAIGYRTARVESGLIDGMKSVLVRNLNDLSAVAKGTGIIVARVGAKKKMDIIKKANEMQIKILNLKGNTK